MIIKISMKSNKLYSWGDNSVIKELTVQARKTCGWVSSIHIRRWIWQITSILWILERQRQADPWRPLTTRCNQISVLGSMRELILKSKMKSSRRTCLMSTCGLYNQMHTCACKHTCAHMNQEHLQTHSTYTKAQLTIIHYRCQYLSR